MNKNTPSSCRSAGTLPRAGLLLLACAALGLLPAPGPLAATAAAQNRPASIDPSFDVLSRKSIFSRDRARPATQQAEAGSGSPGRVLTPEQSHAFRGVMAPDEEFVAFVENIVTQQISILKNGDPLAGGKVLNITLDALEYEAADGKVRQIQLGQDLTGELASAGGGGYSTAGGAGSPGPSPTTGAAATTSAAAPPGSGGIDPAQAAIIERMRQRRREQEGGR